MDGVNLIRGANGAGKTRLLECLALLGHLPVMEIQDSYPLPLDHPRVDITVAIEELYSFSAAASENSPDGLFSGQEITVTFFVVSERPHEVISNLPKVLSEDRLLRKHWAACSGPTPSGPPEVGKSSKHTNREAVETLKRLVAYSRPRCIDKENEQYEQTERISFLKSGPRAASNAASVPYGFVSYFNTDMYEWGAGLDIRESPKAMREELALLIEKRLQVVTSPEGGSAGVHNVLNLSGIQMAWKQVFQRDMISNFGIQRTSTASTPTGSVVVTRSASQASQGFLSSGENQALFMMLMWYSLAARGSVLLLDEPELHLDLDSMFRLYEHVIDLSRDLTTQCICVTHSPAIFSDLCVDFRGSVDAPISARKREAKSRRWSPSKREIHLIHMSPGRVPTYGHQALQASGPRFQRIFRAIGEQLANSRRIGLHKALHALGRELKKSRQQRS